MKKTVPIAAMAWMLMTLTATAQVDPLATPGNAVHKERPRHARLAGLSEGPVAKDDVLKAGGLMLWGGPAGSAVVSFRLTLVAHGTDPVAFYNAADGALTPGMRQAIAGMLPGTRLYFEYIRMKSGDGAVSSLDPLNFVLK